MVCTAVSGAFAADPLSVSTVRLNTATSGTPYSFTAAAVGGTPGYTWSIAGGSLPSGLTLDSATGTISGETSGTGSVGITLSVQDAVGAVAGSQSLTLKWAPPLAIATQALAYGYVGSVYYNITPTNGDTLPSNILTSGGIAPIASVSCTNLPPGLSIDGTGTISGTPTTAGSYNLNCRTEDSSYPTPAVVTRSYTVTIYAQPAVTTTTLPDGMQKSDYSATLNGTGGTSPYSWSLSSGALPAGLTLNAATGVIEGKPTACGSFSFKAKLTDSAPLPKNVDSATLALTVACSNDYLITGNAGVAGAALAWSGNLYGTNAYRSGSVTADGNGNYSIGPLEGGTYKVTPSKNGYIFTPAMKSNIAVKADVPLSFDAVLDTVAPTVSLTLPASTSTTYVSPISMTVSDNAGGVVTGYLITESDQPPAPDAVWKSSPVTNYTFLSAIPDGVQVTKTLYAYAKDAAGNIGQGSASMTVILNDKTKPVVQEFSVPATSTSATVAVTKFSATDNVAVTGYMVTASNVAPSATATGWNSNAPTSYTFTGLSLGTTNKTLYGWAKDASGNVSSYVSGTPGTSAPVAVTLTDTSAPQINSFSMPSTSNSLTVSVTSFTATDDYRVTGYLITESSSVPEAATNGWSTTAPTSFTFATQGPKTVYAWVKDGAGNVSASTSAQVDITLVYDGACGSSNGLNFPAAPTANLCSTGTATTVTGIGPWTWSCPGSGGGTTADCSAGKSEYKPGDCDRNGSVSISEVQGAINMYLGIKGVEACVDQDNGGTVSISEVQKAINSYLGL